MPSSEVEVVYAPGACNIGTDEVAFRRKGGYVTAAITVVLVAALFILDAPWWAFLFITVPASLAAIAFIEVRDSFCVRYAAEGRYNVEPGFEHRTKVDDDDAHAADMAKARPMMVQSVAIGAGIGIALAAISAAVG